MIALVWALACRAAPGPAEPATAPATDAAAALRERYAALRAQADREPFALPVVLQSTEAPDRSQGEVHAQIDHGFERARTALSSAGDWCAILILHVNVKYCRAERAGDGHALHVGIGRKFDQPLADVYWVRFDFRVAQPAADLVQVTLRSPSGPLGTRDYRIVVDLVPGGEGRSIVHMTYAYHYGAAARWAMQVYLATLARDKVGFSVAERRPDGSPVFIGGVRGVVERNAMRYYLAIEAWIAAQAMPPADRLSFGLQRWFDGVERHTRQLHEVGRADYLAMKRMEIQRQATQAPPRQP